MFSRYCTWFVPMGMVEVRQCVGCSRCTLDEGTLRRRRLCAVVVGAQICGVVEGDLQHRWWKMDALAEEHCEVQEGIRNCVLSAQRIQELLSRGRDADGVWKSISCGGRHTLQGSHSFLPSSSPNAASAGEVADGRPVTVPVDLVWVCQDAHNGGGEMCVRGSWDGWRISYPLEDIAEGHVWRASVTVSWWEDIHFKVFCWVSMIVIACLSPCYSLGLCAPVCSRVAGCARVCPWA